MTRQSNEKDEKDEKELDKREEKTAEEKWQRDPLGAVVWAAILIWAGLVFLAGNLGWLDRISIQTGGGDIFLGTQGGWGLIMLGAGVILLIEVLVRLLLPAYRRPVGGTLFLGLLFIAIGLGNWWSWNVIWPFILIALGLSIVLRAIARR